MGVHPPPASQGRVELFRPRETATSGEASPGSVRAPPASACEVDLEPLGKRELSQAVAAQEPLIPAAVVDADLVEGLDLQHPGLVDPVDRPLIGDLFEVEKTMPAAAQVACIPTARGTDETALRYGTPPWHDLRGGFLLRDSDRCGLASPTRPPRATSERSLMFRYFGRRSPRRLARTCEGFDAVGVVVCCANDGSPVELIEKAPQATSGEASRGAVCAPLPAPSAGGCGLAEAEFANGRRRARPAAPASAPRAAAAAPPAPADRLPPRVDLSSRHKWITLNPPPKRGGSRASPPWRGPWRVAVAPRPGVTIPRGGTSRRGLGRSKASRATTPQRATPRPRSTIPLFPCRER